MTGLKSLTVGQVMRMFTGVGASLVIVWSASGHIVKSYADERFKAMLVEQGVDPTVFQKVQEQTTAIGKEIENLGEDSTKIKQDLTSLRSNLNRVADQIENQNKTIEKVEDLVGKLLTIQLQRSDMTYSPPGTAPVGFPQLGSTQ